MNGYSVFQYVELVLAEILVFGFLVRTLPPYRYAAD
jgi:hypothetical protein